MNEEWQVNKAREERRLQGLFDRDGRTRLERDHLELQSRVDDIEQELREY
jgi:hypothetical protein